ncbi:MAG: ABC transporter permease [Chloroflexota bacterium]
MATVTSTASPQIPTLKEETHKPDSIWRMTLRRFFHHRMAVFGLVLMILIVVFVVAGALFVTEDYSNAPNPAIKFEAPSTAHLMGTDQVGRDVLARVVYGGQISLMIAIASVTISIVLGTVVGLVAGYFSGTSQSWIDAILMRIVEALLSFPVLILLLLLSRWMVRLTLTINVLGRELSATAVGVILLIGLTGWMGLSRIVRALVLSLKEREFVLAARTIGASDRRIIFNHILPNCIAPIVVTATLGIGGAIITESYLSFLGFGVQPPTATWGNIMQRVADSFDTAPWLWLFPGGLTVLTVLAINFIGDGLRDALDPRTQK